MSLLNADDKDIWQFLHRDGGAWSADDLAKQHKRDRGELFGTLDRMSRRNLLEKLAPVPGCRRVRFAVTGTCYVPGGVRIAEVQA